MSSETTRRPDVAHEPQGVNVLAISLVSASLLLTLALILWGMSGLVRVFEGGLEAQPPPAFAQPTEPTPSFTNWSDPPADLARLRAEEDARLHGYALVDPARGVVRIPIERAMELVAAEERSAGGAP